MCLKATWLDLCLSVESRETLTHDKELNRPYTFARFIFFFRSVAERKLRRTVNWSALLVVRSIGVALLTCYIPSTVTAAAAYGSYGFCLIPELCVGSLTLPDSVSICFMQPTSYNFRINVPCRSYLTFWLQACVRVFFVPFGTVGAIREIQYHCNSHSGHASALCVTFFTHPSIRFFERSAVGQRKSLKPILASHYSSA